MEILLKRKKTCNSFYDISSDNTNYKEKILSFLNNGESVYAFEFKQHNEKLYISGVQPFKVVNNNEILSTNDILTFTQCKYNKYSEAQLKLDLLIMVPSIRFFTTLESATEEYNDSLEAYKQIIVLEIISLQQKISELVIVKNNIK